ncbi:hypothetical protein [Phytobacter massiliensis]|nr:hypothetical protein [Phytobacter massiliensis]
MALRQPAVSRPPLGLLWLLLCLVALLSLLPSLRLLVSALFDWQQGSNSSLWRVLSNETTWIALRNSLYTSGLGTLLSLLLGSLFAFCLALTNIRGRQIWVFLFMLPMMIPPQVTALSWLQLFGPGSILLNSLGIAPGFGSRTRSIPRRASPCCWGSSTRRWSFWRCVPSYSACQKSRLKPPG